MNSGVAVAIAAYVLWGLLPVYWKAVHTVPALEILGHRTVWSFLFVALLLLLRRRWVWLRTIVSHRTTLLTFIVTACILSINWLTYIWAVNAGYIVDTSLGYFINPLLNVLLGVLFLGERLRPWQWVTITIAAAGVAYLTFNYGAFPWVAVTLAATFGVYGLLRKTAALGALEGLSLETAFMSVPALAYLAYLQAMGAGSFGHTAAVTTTLLVLSGVVSALPLLWFAYAARRVPLSTLGLLQYIAPTLQFLIGVLIYQEAFTLARMVGFSLIWIALALYSFEGLVTRKKRNDQLVQAQRRPASRLTR